jgi:hypothetical protein
MDNSPLVAIERKINDTINILSSIPKNESDIMDLSRMSIENRLDELKEERKRLFELKDKDKFIFVLSGNTVLDNKVSINVLSDILSQFQLMTNVIALSLSKTPAKMGRIPTHVIDQTQLYFKRSFEGSLGIELENYHDDQLSISEPLITSTMTRIYDLLHAGNDPDIILQQAADLGSRAIISYKNFLEYINKNKINVSIKWDNSYSGFYTWDIKHEEIPKIISNLVNIEEIVSEDTITSGRITGINIRRGTFEAILNDDSIISGKALYGVIKKAGNALDIESKLLLSKSTIINHALNKEKTSWHLNEIL